MHKFKDTVEMTINDLIDEQGELADRQRHLAMILFNRMTNEYAWRPVCAGTKLVMLPPDPSWPYQESEPVLGWVNGHPQVVIQQKDVETGEYSWRTTCSEGWDVTGKIEAWRPIRPYYNKEKA